MSDDAALLQAWAARDPAAGQLLLARHYERMRRFFDLRVPEVSEDLTQRTFLACAERRAEYRGEGPFVGFLFGIARRQLAMHLRKRDQDARLVTFAEAAGPDTVTTPTGVIAIKEEQRLLLRAFEQLSEEQQAVIELFYWEGLSTAEVGQVLGVSVSGVTSRLTRARAAMRTFVTELDLRPKTRASVLGDLDGWTRSLVHR